MILGVPRTFRFTMTVTVEDDHEAFDDPEWVPDAAWGSIANEYGLECIYADIEVIETSGEAH